MKEPQDAVVLSARLAKAFPSLSAYSAAALAEELCSIERAQSRHAVRCCNGDYYVDRSEENGAWDEERAEKRVKDRCAKWIGQATVRSGVCFDDGPKIILQGDPRGAVLLLRLPNETEAKAI